MPRTGSALAERAALVLLSAMPRSGALLALTLGILVTAPPEAPAARARRRARTPKRAAAQPPSAKRAAVQPRTPAPFVPPVIVPAAASARDLEISEACRRGLGETRGSVVAMDPYTGRVITIINPQHGL